MPPPVNSARYDNGSDQSGNGMYHGNPVANTPAAALRISSSGSTAGDSAYYSSGSGFTPSTGGQSAPPSNAGLPRPIIDSSSTSAAANSTAPQKYDNSRRPLGYSRQPEELHVPQNYTSMGQSTSRDSVYNSNQEPGRDGGHPGQQYSSSATLPGSLQPGNPGRPHPSSVNTAPSTVPVLPPISTQSQPYSTPSRASTASHSHSYSRSSPAAPFVNTPDDSKLTSPPNHKYTSHPASYSPLGLADIRPRADSGDGPASANPYTNDGYSSVPTNCNYLAPWAVYAFDWCKWPVQQLGLGDAGGKMAIGSYLEDGHNFVSHLKWSNQLH